ncbi:MAG: hypothetical protein PHE29_03115 [Tissierellia bacterium]|nr:hypothetical protein [Tissierellia bacterium]MDD4780235.1 hypothetical protein [Tissierellia bacterium]
MNYDEVKNIEKDNEKNKYESKEKYEENDSEIENNKKIIIVIETTEIIKITKTMKIRRDNQKVKTSKNGRFLVCYEFEEKKARRVFLI